MLPESELPLRMMGAQAFIDYLGPQDEPWVRVLLDEMHRFEGRRWHELAQRMAEPLPCDAPWLKRKAATRVLARLWRRERAAAVPPVEARARLFQAAARETGARDEILSRTAASFGVTPETLAEALFADIRGERRARPPSPAPTPLEVTLRTNLAIAQAVLMHADRLELEILGAARPIVRLAKLHGLLCVVRDAPAGEPPRLELSGPFSLFRHTLLYGRALAALLPPLAWCHRWKLKAHSRVWGRFAEITLESGAPLFPAAAPAPFDSRLEARFARDFARLAPDWDVVREPEPLRAGTTLIFPDFLIQHRIHADRRAFVEIAGFWTAEYVEQKVARLREAGIANLILCVDEARLCGRSEPPTSWRVVPFRKRVDAAEVLRAVEAVTANAEVSPYRSESDC